jgi:hypothetical protein
MVLIALDGKKQEFAGMRTDKYANRFDILVSRIGSSAVFMSIALNGEYWYSEHCESLIAARTRATYLLGI